MSNVSKATKKKSTKKKSKAKAKSNGAAQPSAGAEVVRLGEDDALTVRSAHQTIVNGQATLGAIREQFLTNENAQRQAIAKARQDFESVMHTLAKKHGIDLENDQWTFNLADMSFTPRQG